MAKGLDSRNDVRNQAIVNLQAENAELRRQNDEFKLVYSGLTEQNRMLRGAITAITSIVKVAEKL
jgi:hypothetical protein